MSIRGARRLKALKWYTNQGICASSRRDSKSYEETEGQVSSLQLAASEDYWRSKSGDVITLLYWLNNGLNIHLPEWNSLLVRKRPMSGYDTCSGRLHNNPVTGLQFPVIIHPNLLQGNMVWKDFVFFRFFPILTNHGLDSRVRGYYGPWVDPSWRLKFGFDRHCRKSQEFGIQFTRANDISFVNDIGGAIMALCATVKCQPHKQPQ